MPPEIVQHLPRTIRDGPPHSNNSLKKKLKGRGSFFHTRKGFGIIKVTSEINENVPDRKRFIDEALNNPNIDKPGLYCSYVRHI